MSNSAGQSDFRHVGSGQQQQVPHSGAPAPPSVTTPPPPPATGGTPSDGPFAAAPPAPSTGDQPGRRRGLLSRLVGFITDKGIPLLIAILGLATALATTWGALAVADKNDAEDTNSSLTRENQTLVQQVNDLTVQVEDLTADRDRLQDELDAADKTGANEVPPAATGDGNGDDGSSSSTVTTPEQPSDSSVFRETGSTPVTFSSGYSIELDATDADWGVEDSSTGDLYFYLGDSGPFLSTGEISLVDHIPTEVECDDATVLQTQLNRGQTQVGAQMCMRTSEDRLSYVHIANIDEDNRTITLDIIVWE